MILSILESFLRIRPELATQESYERLLHTAGIELDELVNGDYTEQASNAILNVIEQFAKANPSIREQLEDYVENLQKEKGQ